MPAVAAASGVQVCTGTFVVTAEGAQVIVIQLLPAIPVCGLHVATATLLALLLPQVMVSQLLPEPPLCGVQVWTGTFDVLLLPHTVAT